MTDQVKIAEAELAAAEIAVATANKRHLAARSALRIARARAHAAAEAAAIKAKYAARRAARRLAAKIGVEIELHADLGDDCWFVSHPALIDTPQDPHEGDHYAHDWTEIARRVQDYADALKQAA